MPASDRSGRTPALWAPERSEGPRLAPAPPAVDRDWTAEVEWDHSTGASRFRAVASLNEGVARITVAESAPLEWPPRGADSLEELRRAVEQLETSLLAAGWKPLPAGEAWYGKRFAWEAVRDRPSDGPKPRETRQPERARRFARRSLWPDETEALWRCELEWHASLVNSRFEAVMHEPGGGRRAPIAASHSFRLQFGRDPDWEATEHRDEVDRLTGALEAEGWERVGDGPHWFSRRFVWRGEERPTERLEPRRPTTAAPERS
jgi:hypothetical protein